eukprot:1365188-Alexandrium_andersonii.AAC.1
MPATIRRCPRRTAGREGGKLPPRPSRQHHRRRCPPASPARGRPATREPPAARGRQGPRRRPPAPGTSRASPPQSR